MAKSDKVLCGVQPVKELVRSGQFIKKIWIEKGKSESKFSDLIESIKEQNISIGEKSSRFIEKLSGTDKHQGIAAIYVPKEHQFCFEKGTPRKDHFLCLYLDQIQDPHNFGAIVRSAENFAVDQIFYPEFGSAPFNATAVKSSSGAMVHNPPMKIKSPSRFFDKMRDQGFRVIGAEHDSRELISTYSFDKDTLIVIGNEGEGISQKIKQYCDTFHKIPSLGQINSLNASVASAIMMYELRRMS